MLTITKDEEDEEDEVVVVAKTSCGDAAAGTGELPPFTLGSVIMMRRKKRRARAIVLSLRYSLALAY